MLAQSEHQLALSYSPLFCRSCACSGLSPKPLAWICHMVLSQSLLLIRIFFFWGVGLLYLTAQKHSSALDDFWALSCFTWSGKTKKKKKYNLCSTFSHPRGCYATKKSTQNTQSKERKGKNRKSRSTGASGRVWGEQNRFRPPRWKVKNECWTSVNLSRFCTPHLLSAACP